MSNNFNAQELTSLEISADNLFKEIVESIKEVREACLNMSGVVKSEDSGLASAWDNVAQAILDPVTKAESSLGAVGKTLKSYVDQTVANENNSEKELGAIQEEIGSLGQMANGIVDLGGKIPAPPSGPRVKSEEIQNPGTKELDPQLTKNIKKIITREVEKPEISLDGKKSLKMVTEKVVSIETRDMDTVTETPDSNLVNEMTQMTANASEINKWKILQDTHEKLPEILAMSKTSRDDVTQVGHEKWDSYIRN